MLWLDTLVSQAFILLLTPLHGLESEILVVSLGMVNLGMPFKNAQSDKYIGSS